MSFHISSSSKLKTCNETPWFGFEFYQTLEYLQNRERGVFGVEIVATWPTSVWHKSWKQMERNTLRSFWTNTRDQFREIQHLGERGDFRGGIVATFTTAVWQWQQQQVRTNPSSAARTQTGFHKDDFTTQICVRNTGDSSAEITWFPMSDLMDEICKNLSADSDSDLMRKQVNFLQLYFSQGSQ